MSKEDFWTWPNIFLLGTYGFLGFQRRIPYPCEYWCHTNLVLIKITRFMSIQAEMWDNVHELPLAYTGLFSITHSLRNQAGCTCQEWLVLLQTLLGQPQNSPVGTLAGCCALEKSSPALFPVEQLSSLQQKCTPRHGIDGQSFPPSFISLCNRHSSATESSGGSADPG